MKLNFKKVTFPDVPTSEAVAQRGSFLLLLLLPASAFRAGTVFGFLASYDRLRLCFVLLSNDIRGKLRQFAISLVLCFLSLISPKGIFTQSLTKPPTYGSYCSERSAVTITINFPEWPFLMLKYTERFVQFSSIIS